MGIDLAALLARADEMARACAANVSAEMNPGLWLGVVFATLAQAGRDKITLIASRGIETFGAWAEQLIAESTGKEGKGLVPVDGEPLSKPLVYGSDRVFVYVQLGKKKDAALELKLRALEKTGQPVIRLHLRDAYDIGAEFFRWEFAVAVAGALMGIDAFDQPNVQESKDNTKRVLGETEDERRRHGSKAHLGKQAVRRLLDHRHRQGKKPARRVQGVLAAGARRRLSCVDGVRPADSGEQCGAEKDAGCRP